MLISSENQQEIVFAPNRKINAAPNGELCVLGNLLTAEISSKKILDFRINKCWKAYWAIRPLLWNRKAPLKARLQLLRSSVFRCLMFGLETIALTRGHMQCIDRTLTDMLYWMIPVARTHGEY